MVCGCRVSWHLTNVAGDMCGLMSEASSLRRLDYDRCEHDGEAARVG